MATEGKKIARTVLEVGTGLREESSTDVPQNPMSVRHNQNPIVNQEIIEHELKIIKPAIHMIKNTLDSYSPDQPSGEISNITHALGKITIDTDYIDSLKKIFSNISVPSENPTVGTEPSGTDPSGNDPSGTEQGGGGIKKSGSLRKRKRSARRINSKKKKNKMTNKQRYAKSTLNITTKKK